MRNTFEPSTFSRQPNNQTTYPSPNAKGQQANNQTTYPSPNAKGE
ncbi:hypothetical protein BJP36_36780 [Moorena producens JHB]|uniref:Uncharacterized protein n=1 Tax=Moorena producens (strain JHB) TaxID=1454205 RepID=A0A9Q9UWA2_MOOP1|nr:hypothetical protein [Moorena producens]WAN69648.1 hypothetical protein BJP36_36780 [Moorena producens JHB]